MSVFWTERAGKQLAAIQRSDAKLAGQVKLAVEKLHDTGHGDVKMLKGAPGEFRVRVRKYRIKGYWDGDVLVVLEVGHRSSIYR
ncbi:MAG: type II toxin-antitoxin system RelE/ParE family toxin [Deltaproteobacteria bacterium]|nr:type II toxin-antitoxin system RelE/ParE family toxin [Deltaproteobacteria bacterium]